MITFPFHEVWGAISSVEILVWNLRLCLLEFPFDVIYCYDDTIDGSTGILLNKQFHLLPNNVEEHVHHGLIIMSCYSERMTYDDTLYFLLVTT